MIIAALDTGMRRGEITNQRREDIDFPRRLLFVTRSKTPEGESREIPLSERLFQWLAENRCDQGIVFAYEGEQVRIIKRSWKSVTPDSQDGKFAEAPRGHNRLACADNMTAGSVGRGSVGRSQWTFTTSSLYFKNISGRVQES